MFWNYSSHNAFGVEMDSVTYIVCHNLSQLSVPVSVSMDVQTTLLIVYLKEEYWRKLKNIVILREILELKGASFFYDI